MDQLTFDAGLGTYTVNVAPDSVGISKGLGTHHLKLQLDVGIPEVGPEAGRLLSLETTLYVPQRSGPRVPLAVANTFVAFNPTGRSAGKRSSTS